MSEGTGQVSPGVAGLCILQFLTSYQYNSGLLLDRTSFYSLSILCHSVLCWVLLTTSTSFYELDENLN